MVLALLFACSGRWIGADVALTQVGGGASASALAASCDASALSCAPSDLGGRIWSGGAMLELPDGGWNLTMLGATREVIEDPSQGMGGELEFSLAESTVLGGEYVQPTGLDAEIAVSEMSFSYDWLDATFSLEGLPEGSPLAGEITVRTVLATTASAPDVSGEMRLGDKLVRLAGEGAFRWCDEAGCRESRPDKPHIDESIADYERPGEGNPDYVPFVFPLAEPLTLPREILEGAGHQWTVDFDLAGAVSFASPPADAADLSALVEAFHLEYDGGNSGEGPALSASLAVE